MSWKPSGLSRKLLDGELASANLADRHLVDAGGVGDVLDDEVEHAQGFDETALVDPAERDAGAADPPFR